ncbi:MAG: MFS transporter [Deltaproteobacteria bacterium]|nr:MFS transporter [Deltaproteobacteria bacterium]
MTDEHKVVLLASASHFITHGFMTMFPVLMVAIANENSMSFTGIGLVANIGYFLYGAGAFPAGYLADRFGSKRMLTIGIMGMALGSFLVGLSGGIWSFAISYALLGLFASIHHPAGLSLIARRVKNNRGQALGIHGVMGNVGLFMAPLIAASCIWLFNSWRAAYFLYGIVGTGFAMLLYKSRIPDEVDFSFRAAMGRNKRSATKGKLAQETEEGRELAAPAVIIPLSLLVLFLVSTLSGYIFRGSLTFFPALFRQEVHFIANNARPVVMAGYMTTAVLSLGLVGAWFGGYITDRLKRPELFPALVFGLVAPILYLISRSADNALTLYAGLFSLIYYSWQPAQNYLISKYTRKASHGMGFGVNFFLIFGLGSLATTTGGYVTDHYGVESFYRLLAIVALTAVIAALTVFFVRRHSLRLPCHPQKK